MNVLADQFEADCILRSRRADEILASRMNEHFELEREVEASYQADLAQRAELAAEQIRLHEILKREAVNILTRYSSNPEILSLACKAIGVAEAGTQTIGELQR